MWVPDTVVAIRRDRLLTIERSAPFLQTSARCRDARKIMWRWRLPPLRSLDMANLAAWIAAEDAGGQHHDRAQQFKDTLDPDAE